MAKDQKRKGALATAELVSWARASKYRWECVGKKRKTRIDRMDKRMRKIKVQPTLEGGTLRADYNSHSKCAGQHLLTQVAVLPGRVGLR